MKLECNPTARIYRKHFLGKVGGLLVWGGWAWDGAEPLDWGWVTILEPRISGSIAWWIHSLIQRTLIAKGNVMASWLTVEAVPGFASWLCHLLHGT